ncbi:MAG: hypothetical protein ACPH8E_05865, partial [Flavobacteriales bacterium]
MFPLLAGLFLLTSTQANGQTTIWTEDFTGEETNSSETTLFGDQWSATYDDPSSTGNKTPLLSVGDGEFTWTGPTNGSG